MKINYRGELIKIPEDNTFQEIQKWIIGFCIDFAFISLPILVLLGWYFIQFSSDLFFLLYIPSLLIAIFWIYIVFVNFYNIKINKFVFKSNKITKPFKFVFISDLHIGHARYSTNKLRLNRIIKKINSLDKELTILGGDLLDYNYTLDLLKELYNIEGKKITILGNHDSKYMKRGIYTKETPIKLINELKILGFKVLFNTGEKVSDEVFIGGIKDLYSADFDIEKSFEGANSKQYKILLSHNPDIISYQQDLKNVDLILSGHNHAGQIDIFGIHLPMPSLRQWLVKGIYKITDNTTLLLSQGIGVGLSRVRLGTDFEICYVQLEPLEEPI